MLENWSLSMMIVLAALPGVALGGSIPQHVSCGFLLPRCQPSLFSSVLAKILLDFGCFARVPAVAVQHRPNVSQSRAAMTITVFSEIDFIKRWHHKYNNQVHAFANSGFRASVVLFSVFFVLADKQGAVSLKENSNLWLL